MPVKGGSRWRKFVAWATARPEPRWRVTSEGLVADGRLYPWSAIETVEEAPRWFVIHTTVGEIRLEPKDAPARRIARRVRERLARRDGEAAGLTVVEIEGWLGVLPGKELVVDAPSSRWLPYLGVLYVAALAWMLNPRAGMIVLLLVIGLEALSPFFAERASENRVTADATGLRWGLRAEADWADVTAISRDGTGWRVSTDSDDGGVRLVGRNAEVVAEAIQKILAARRSGAVLPRMTEVPETALSRAAASEAAVDRGLSRPE